MMTLLVIAGIMQDPTLPPVSDADRFPVCAIARVQKRRCAEWRDRMEFLGRVRGWEGGRWQKARQEFEDRRVYWQWLIEVHGAWPADNARVVLKGFKEFIGPVAYRDGWSPKQMTEVPELFKPKTPDVILLAPVNPGGANGQ